MFSLVCGWADVGVLPSCPQQDGTRESKQDEAFLDEKDPRIKAGSKGGAPGAG